LAEVIIMLSETYRDLKYSSRTLRKHPGFAAVVIITLALGIGANTAIFSFVNAVILNPLPFPDSDRLVVMSQTNHEGGEISVSLLNFQDWQARSRSFDEFGGVCFTTFNLTGVDIPPQHLPGQQVTLNYFSILGVQPQLGRIFSPEEDKFGAPRTALISDSLWRTAFGADPNIVGRTIKLDSETVTVIGVMPPRFELFTKPDILVPLGGALDPNSPWFDRGNHMGLYALGRLRKGISVSQAETEMRQIAAQLEKEYPAVNSGHGVLTQSLQASVVLEVRSTLLVLMGAVGFVLLIACVNVANLSLARSLLRQQEMGIRMALGAGRGRLIRQSLSESFLLSLLGGLAGIFVARWLLSALVSLAPPNLPRLADVQLSGRVLLFTAAVTVLTSLLFGLLPALSSTRITAAFSESRTSTSGPLRRRLFDSLLVAEIAFALIVLTGAGLLTRTMYKIANVDPGFRTDHLLTMRMDIYGPQYRNNLPNIQAFQDAALPNIKALPGVESAAFTLSLPIAGSQWGSVFVVGDQPVLDRSQIPIAAFNPVSPEYFQTMGIRLLQGRSFTEADGLQSPKVAVINESMARHFWPNENPIGKRLKQGWPEWTTPWREVIGVVADVKLNGVIDTTPLHVYLPLSQEGMASVYLAVRTRQEPQALAASVQSTLHSLDSQVPIYQVRTMDERLKAAVVSQRAAMVLLSAFAVVAMLLAAVGIYGVISWGVLQRTREMGLRMALGALPREVMWLVLRRSMLLVSAGVILGLLGAFAVSRVLGASLTETGPGKTPLLFGVQAVDPITFIIAPILLALVAFIACCLPAWRVTKIDPLVALRYE